MEDWTDEEFTTYLRNVADEFEADGHEQTAKDYREAARRIEGKS